MTVIEKQYMDAVIAMNRKMADQNKVDWERYRRTQPKMWQPTAWGCILPTGKATDLPMRKLRKSL